MAAKQFEIVLTSDRVTKGAVRFIEENVDYPISIYLRKEQVEELGLEVGLGKELRVTIKAG